MTSVSMVEVHSPYRQPDRSRGGDRAGANEWPHDRSCDEEMVVEISGRWCDYRLFFVWQREMRHCITPAVSS